MILINLMMLSFTLGFAIAFIIDKFNRKINSDMI
jgi:hypothetical protein